MLEERLDLGIGNLGRSVVLRLKPGMKIFETLKEVATEHNITYALILNGVGAIKEARIRNLLAFTPEFPLTDKERVFVDTKGPMELLSLQGSISRTEAGDITVHGHVVFCGVQPSGSAFGGHLVEAEVYSTTEISLVEVLDCRLLRAICPETKALELKPTSK